MTPQPAREPAQEAAKGEEKTLPEKLRMVGGLTAVAIGVAAVMIVAIFAVFQNPGAADTISSSAGGVIATIVGAYFGVKFGVDQSKTEAAKAQVYALHLPAEEAERFLKQANAAARRALRN